MKNLRNSNLEKKEIEIKNTKYFCIDHLQKDIRRKSKEGSVVTLVAQLTVFFFKTVTTMILARILTPQDYGIFGLVIAFMGLLLLIKDMGLSMATVQREDISHYQVSNLFWINFLFGLLLFILALFLGPVISNFYKEPILNLITILLATGLIFAGLTVQHQALLKRQMRFLSLSIIQVISMLVSSIISIIAAFFGMRYWALVLQTISLNFFICIGVWFCCGWRPSLPCFKSGTKSLLVFGAHLSGFTFFNYFIRNSDKIIVGKYLGPHHLGIYNKSYQLILLPINQIITPISSVVIPALSRLQNDDKKYRDYYCILLNRISYIIIPAVTICFCLTNEIVLILLGGNWIETVVIFKILVIVCIFQPLLGTSGWIFVSLGNTKPMMYCAILSLPFYIIAYFIGVKWGVAGTAIGYVIVDFIIRIIQVHVAFRKSPVCFTDLIKSIWRPLFISIFLFFIISFTKPLLSTQNILLNIFLTLILSGIYFIITAFLWKSFRTEVTNLIKIPLQMFFKN